MIIAPDVGAVKKCDYFAEKLGVPVLAAIERRDYAPERHFRDHPRRTEAIPQRSAIIIDDLADTCGTLERVIQVAVAGGSGMWC